MSVTYLKAVKKSTLDGRLRHLMEHIAFTVLDDVAIDKRKKKGERPREFRQSIAEVADVLGCRTETVYAQLRALVEVGLLTVKAPGGGRKRFSSGCVGGVATVYEFHPEKLTPRPPRHLAKIAKAQPEPVLGPLAKTARDTTGPLAKTAKEEAGPLAKNGGAIYVIRALSGNKEVPGVLRTSDADAPDVETPPALVAQIQTPVLEEPRLFDTERSQPLPPRKTDPAIKRCLDAYFAGYVARFGKKPLVFGGKHGQQFKQLLAALAGDEAEVLALIDRFFASTHPWVTASDYSVGALVSRAPTLLIEDQQPRDRRTLENLDAARRATRRRAAVVERRVLTNEEE